MKRSIAWMALLLTLGGCSGGMGKRHFENVERAGRDIESAVAGKADLERYRALVTAFSSEVERARSEATSASEREVVEQYGAAQSSLQDILLVWEEKNRVRQELLPLVSPLASRLQKQYELPVNTNEPPSIYASEAMQMIWDVTKKKLQDLSAE